MPTRVGWDSCVFIDLLEQTAGRYDACEEMRKKAEEGNLVIVTSAIALVEVCKLPTSGLSDQEQSQKITDFFENPYITIRAVDRLIATAARELTRTHGLTAMDAVHVATALEMAVEVLYTYDSVKGKRKGLLRHNLQIGKPPLRIEEPKISPAGPLFQGSPGAP